MNISKKAKGIIDSCRFCWMCRHICPIGNATGLERNTARARALGASLVVRGATELKEISDNVYECTLCGACTNNCMTGWDPKVFIQELKTEIVLNGVAPDYIMSLLEKYQNSGNVFGLNACDCLNSLFEVKSDVALLVGQTALYKTPESVKKAVELLNKANVKVALDKNQDSGAALWFLTGKTAETLSAAKKVAESMNTYKTVIVYDPVDLSLIMHEYKEWGIEIKAKVVGFNEYVLGLIENGALKVKKSDKEYSLQDNYAYARELDDSETGRKLIEKVGKNKDMLLIGKEANLAGQLIMAEYMPQVMQQVALDRWTNAINMDCKTVVTENPAEYVALKATKPDGYNVISVEEMILENL
ncbi:MAG: (Fe-S)-binding protein [Clostridia bacterium]|nr:(Fe-S)-binding protein [Clostridia bacterium]